MSRTNSRLIISDMFFSGELKSVYVRNLPSTVSTADIQQEFKTFGRITADGVFIRNRKVIFLLYAHLGMC